MTIFDKRNIVQLSQGDESMNSKSKEISINLLIILVMMIASFSDFNGAYFILAIPLLAVLAGYKNSYFIYGLLGMFIVSLILNVAIFPIVLLVTFLSTWLFSIILTSFKLSAREHLSISGAFFGFVLSVLFYLCCKQPLVNIIFVPLLSYFLCYYVTNMSFQFKSRENFSLTRKELTLVSFFISSIIFQLNVNIWNFNVSLVLLIVTTYVLMKMDFSIAIIATVLCLMFNLNSREILLTGVYLLTFVFALRPVNLNRYLGSLIYIFACSAFLIYFKNILLLREAAFSTMVIIFIPDRVSIYLSKYVVDPKDYELKLYQQSYYRCLNRNKKIQKVMNSLESQMKNNPNLKKSNKDIVLQNMKFLSDKLKEEEDIHIKSHILNDLKYSKIDVVGLKINIDYLDNYFIDIEIKNNDINLDKIIEILENRLDIKLKEERCYFNRIINTHRYIIVNNQKLLFNHHIKQRSKDGGICGDNYLYFNIKNKKYILVSDGMGHGKKASKESSEALFLLKSFIELEMKPKDAIVLCNALLVDKDKEIFNTLDLLEYDIFSNELFLYKNGSGITYLKTSEGVKKVLSENLPLGIVEQINVEKLKFDTDVDFIVLTSDGIKKDLTSFIENSKGKNSKQLAQEIMNYEGDSNDDDQTIVVINVIKNS